MNDAIAKITNIKTFKVVLSVECDCGKVYRWTPKMVNCPDCGTEHELVLALRSILKIKAIDEIKPEGS
jgi:DNA polymerase II large subunit